MTAGLLEDLGSRNGTLLNGQPILLTHVRLEDSDLIEVAGFAITFARKIEGGIGEPVRSQPPAAEPSH